MLDIANNLGYVLSTILDKWQKIMAKDIDIVFFATFSNCFEKNHASLQTCPAMEFIDVVF